MNPSSFFLLLLVGVLGFYVFAGLVARRYTSRHRLLLIGLSLAMPAALYAMY